MEKELLLHSNVIKKEDIGYLKSKLNLQQGTLTLTDKKLILGAHKTTVGGFGLLGALLKNKIEKVNIVFDLEFNQIQSINEGKFGTQSGVLEIRDKQNNSYRILVKSYADWESIIKQQLN